MRFRARGPDLIVLRMNQQTHKAKVNTVNRQTFVKLAHGGVRISFPHIGVRALAARGIGKPIRTDVERKKLSMPAQYGARREEDTEHALGIWLDGETRKGKLTCIASGLELFPCGSRFDNSKGWAHFDNVRFGHVPRETDFELAAPPRECPCARSASRHARSQHRHGASIRSREGMIK